MNDLYRFLLFIYSTFLIVFLFIFSMFTLGMKENMRPGLAHYIFILFILFNVTSLIFLPYISSKKETLKKIIKIFSLMCLTINFLISIKILWEVIVNGMDGGTTAIVTFTLFIFIITTLAKIIINDKLLNNSR